MYKRDYIQRLVEEGAKVVARMLGLRKEGRHEKAAEVANEAMETYTGYTFAQIDNITLDTFHNFVENSGIEPERLELMAYLLVEKETVDIEMLQPVENSKEKYNKALMIFEFLNKTQPHTFSMARNQKISEIKGKLHATG